MQMWNSQLERIWFNILTRKKWWAASQDITSLTCITTAHFETRADHLEINTVLKKEKTILDSFFKKTKTQKGSLF